LPTITKLLEKVEEKPDLVFIKGHGITHPRLGLASHFSLVTGIPAIGVAENLLIGEVRNKGNGGAGEDIVVNGKVKGKVLQTREGSKPIYISPGNLISVESALELTKKFIRQPHKLPEPLHLAHKFAKKVMKELR